MSSVYQPPPTYEESTSQAPSNRQVSPQVELSEDEVRIALTQFVSEHCCYGRGPAQNMTIRNITMNSSFQVSIATEYKYTVKFTL